MSKCEHEWREMIIANDAADVNFRCVVPCFRIKKCDKCGKYGKVLLDKEKVGEFGTFPVLKEVEYVAVKHPKLRIERMSDNPETYAMAMDMMPSDDEEKENAKHTHICRECIFHVVNAVNADMSSVRGWICVNCGYMFDMIEPEKDGDKMYFLGLQELKDKYPTLPVYDIEGVDHE